MYINVVKFSKIFKIFWNGAFGAENLYFWYSKSPEMCTLDTQKGPPWGQPPPPEIHLW